MMEIISRKDAITSGKSYYFTGVPCKHGHLSKRHVTGCSCCECIREFSQNPESKEKKSAWWRTDERKEISRQRSKKYHTQNREECLEKMRKRNKEYYQNNSERIKKQALAYQAENSIERNKYKNKWTKKKIENDPVFRMAMVCRRMLHRALGVAGQVKYKRTQDYLPYTYSELVKKLESQFKPGMTWDNYGKWHIDHKTPLSYFIKNGITSPAIINSLSNLQPLWAADNMAKGDKVA